MNETKEVFTGWANSPQGFFREAFARWVNSYKGIEYIKNKELEFQKINDGSRKKILKDHLDCINKYIRHD